MAEDQGKIPQKVSVESTPAVSKQLADKRQQEKLRQKQISEIRRSYIIHGRAA